MLRYYGDDDDGFEIVREESEIQGIVDASAPTQVNWTIHIEWHNPDIEKWEFRKAWIEIGDLSFNEGNWKDLVGREAHAAYEPEDVRPIMPGNPANFFYCMGHETPNSNHVRILERNGPDFTFEWRGKVEDVRPPGIPFEIQETVTLKNMYVVFKSAAGVDLKLARRLVTKFIDDSEVGEPTVTGVSGNWVQFPVRVKHDRPVPPAEPKPSKKKLEETDATLIALKELGAKIKRDKKQPGNPLVSIDLHSCENADKALMLVKDIPDLGLVDLHAQGVTDCGLEALKDRKLLWSLSLGGPRSSITDAGLAHLQGLTGLRSFHISGSPITDLGLTYLRDMTELRTLDLNNTQISDASMEVLDSMVELTRLTLTGSGITDAGLIHLRGLTKLEYLHLHSTNVKGEGLIHLKSLQQLVHLNMNSGAMADPGLAVIGGLTQLDALGLMGTSVTDAGLPQLKGLKKLRRLFANQTKVTKEGAAALRKYLPKLEIQPFWFP